MTDLQLKIINTSDLHPGITAKDLSETLRCSEDYIFETRRRFSEGILDLGDAVKTNPNPLLGRLWA